jgi:hypothetical protein
VERLQPLSRYTQGYQLFTPAGSPLFAVKKIICFDLHHKTAGG